MKITQKQFLADVMHEIETLKKHATAKEKSKLDIEYLRPYNAEHCIYGQMTGDCRTPRALHLMKKSCVRIFDLKKDDLYPATPLKQVVKQLNGPFEEQGWTPGVIMEFRRDWKYLSALEGYIQLRRNNAGVIAYIKGEIDTLKL